MKYIHERGVLHRDIKTSNLFLSSSGVVKVGDFGVSRVLHGTLERAQTVVGTPYYMSPEVCKNEPYSFRSDMWSLGCILYELCTLNRAFSGQNLLSLLDSILKKPHKPLPSNYSKNLNELVNKLLKKDPADRPSCDDLLKTKFMQKVLHKFLHPDSMIELDQQSDFFSEDEIIEETPLQRLKRKKEEAAKEREEEIRKAVKNNSNEMRMSHSRLRKKEQLQSVFDKTRQEYNDYPTMTIESVQLSGNFNRSKVNNNQIKEGLKENYSQQTYYRNTLMKSNKSFVTIQSQYIEDLPNRKSQILKNSTVKEEEEDEFESDFEDLEESIVDEVVLEDNNSFSTIQSENKSQKYRKKLEEQIGHKLFRKLYSYMKDQKESGADEKTIKQSMRNRFGNDSLVHVFKIEQLLFMENN